MNSLTFEIKTIIMGMWIVEEENPSSVLMFMLMNFLQKLINFFSDNNQEI